MRGEAAVMGEAFVWGKSEPSPSGAALRIGAIYHYQRPGQGICSIFQGNNLSICT